MTTSSPIERYSLTSCDIFRTFPSLSEFSYLGSLLSSHPELLKCDTCGGVRVDLKVLLISQQKVHPPPPVLLATPSTLANLQEHMLEINATGFAAAAWFTPSLKNRAPIQPIVTIGGKKPPNLLDDLVTPGCPGYDFQIAQFQGSILVSFTDGDPARNCIYIRAYDAPLTNVTVPTHVAVTIDSHFTYIYVNGNAVVAGAPNMFDPTLQHWSNMTPSALQLFTTSASNNTFQGAIHQVDMFDRCLNASQVVAVHQQGIIYVQPSKITVTAKVDKVSNVIRQDSTEPLSLNLASWNTTKTVFKLVVKVITLPKHGILSFNRSAAVNLTAESRVPIAMNSSTVVLEYKLNSTEYFNVPTVNAYNEDLHLEPESFQFRVLALNAKSKVIAMSAVVTQYVHVIHVNHPGVLSAPAEAILDVVDPTMAIVTGTDYSDPLDCNMDRVRVDLWAEHGELSLHPAFVTLADFNSCRLRGDDATSSSWWQCTGDGIQDRNMTFVAVPSDIPFILRNLTYRQNNSVLSSTTTNTKTTAGGGITIDDTITVRVLDGSGGMCLDEAEHIKYQARFNNTVTFTSIRDGCFQQQAVVRVFGSAMNNTVNPNKNSCGDGGGGGIFGSDFLSLASLLFWGLVIVFIAGCALLCCRIFRCIARGKAVEVDDNSICENVCEESRVAGEV